MKAAGTDLIGISALDELGDTIPGFGTNPSNLLGLHEPFSKLNTLVSATEETLEDEIDALDIGGFDFYDTDVVLGPPTTVTFKLSAARTVDVPLLIASDDVQVAGVELDATVTLAETTFKFEFDPSIGGPADAFALVAPLPTLSLGATITGSVNQTVQFGFADANATGTANLDTNVNVALVDPDGSGRLTGTELATNQVADVTTLSFPATAPDDVDIDLTLTASVAGVSFGGTLSVSDANLFDDPAASISVTPSGTNPIDLLSNLTPETAITSLTQLVSSIGAAMSGGDLKLPFLGDGVFIPGDLGVGDDADFDRVYDAIRPILNYVEPLAAGQIICGSLLTTSPGGGADGLPAGSVRDMKSGEKVYCRAFTASDGTAITWTAANATQTVDAPANAASVGTAPTQNVEFTMNADDEFDVSVEYTPTGGDPTTIEQRPDTIQELAAELDVAGLIADAADLDYNASLQSFEFPIGTTVAGFSRDVTVDAGSSLVADTGLTGLAAAQGGASASIEVSNIDAGITLGLIAVEDEADINPGDNSDPDTPPGPGDRFYVKTDGPIISVETVELTGDISMVGRLGFLEVAADASGTLARPDTSANALEVSLSDTVANAHAVEVDGSTDPDAILVRDLLSGLGLDSFDPDVNLEFNGSIGVSATLPGNAAALEGSIDVEWDLSNPNHPLLTPHIEFQQNLLPFGGNETLTHMGGPNADDTIFTASGGLLSNPGLVGAQLIDPVTGATCNITSIISDTTLRCENPAQDDGNDATPVDQNPITFADGTSYDVAGNTLAYLADILAAIEGLVTYLEEQVGEGEFAEPLPVIDVTPAEIVDQIGELRRMVDEFRGVQDATITCTVNDDPTIDPRAIPIANAGGTATLKCHAANSSAGVTNVRWRVNGDAQNGTFVNGDPGTVGAGAGTVSLTVTAPSTEHDGFVSLGTEYTVEVEWTESAETHTASYPPRTPRSLQHLADLISEALDLPDGVLQFSLVDPTNPDLRTLRIDIKYGICSDPAPSFPAGEDDPCEGMPTALAPSADLNFDLGASLPPLVGLETTGTIDVMFAALGQFNIGIPLDGDTPVLYAGTGLEARLEVSGDNLGVNASLGPVSASLGPDAGNITGSATDASATQLIDSGANFTAAGNAVPVGAIVTNTTTGNECTATVVTATTIDCDAEWEAGEGYKIGGLTQLEGAIGFELQVADGGGALTGDESVAINLATVAFTPFETFLAGNANCADIGTLADEVVTDSDGDDSGLEGIICGRFSMELGLGSASLYLGELGLDLDSGGLTIYVPNDLANQLLNAALNPAFLIQALPGLLKTVEDGMRSAADSGAPAPIADPLRAGADGIGVIREGVEGVIETFGDSLSLITDMGDLGAAVDTELTGLLQGLIGPDLDVEVEVTTDCGGSCDGQSPLALQDIRAQVTIGQVLTVEQGINLGLEGLPISIEGGIEAFADWHVTAGIGVSRADGPYLDVSADTEVGVTAGVELLTLSDPPAACQGPIALTAQDENWANARCLNGRLVFLFITAIDNADTPSNITASLGFNVTSGTDDRVTLSNLGGIDIDFTLNGTVYLDLAIRTGIGDGSPDFPSVLGRFVLDWDVDLGVGEDIPSPTISFTDLHLDLGTFITGFLDPIVNEVKKITGPLQPIIDVLMAPIPVVSDLAELVGADPITMISLLEAATGADLSLVKAMAAFITFVNAVGDLDGSLQIPLGEAESPRDPGKFNVDAAAASTSVASSEAGKLIKQDGDYEGGDGFANDIASSSGSLPGTGTTDGRPSTFGVPGLSFPFLEDASQIFGILVGRDATLIRWDAGTLEAKAGFSYDFGPIMVGPVPITITIGGEVGVRGRFAIGYDTSGIRQVLDGGSGVALFDGIFIDDLDAAGNDVPEITFFGKVFAGASVDLVIISAGVRGGIELTFSLDLDDRPDPDGKLRILEIVDKLQNPICLFVVSGKIEAFLEAFVKIDLFFFTEEFSFELVRITLLEWSSACEPPEPNLTEGDGTEILYLKTGERTPGRNIAEDNIDDKIEVRQIGDGVVRVSGFGWEEVHRGVGLIVADGGKGSDEFLFLPGTLEGTDGIPDTPETPEDAELVRFTIPVVVSGGPGTDIIKSGEGADKIHGDAHEGDTTWLGFDYDGVGGPGSGEDDTEHGDNINAGPGNDLVRGGDGNDTVEGEFGHDTILGQGGDDNLKGGPGPDAIDGGLGGDTVQGGPIDQPSDPASADDNDALVGGPDRDVVSGDFGDDIIFGDDAFSGFFNDSGDGRFTFSAPSLETWTDDWCPAAGDVNGTPGDDILTGTDGADTITGGGGNDKIDGDAGDDLACGGPGNDEVVGDVGGDHLRGDAGDDLLTGFDGDDLMYGGADNDTGNGDNGDDDMFGGTGSDSFSGNAGDDVIVGDDGEVADRTIDGIVVDGNIDPTKVDDLDDNTTRESTSSGARRDSCFVTLDDSDCLFGGTGSDALFGGSDGDFIFGEVGVDLLEGNDGPDELRGGTEKDLLLGSGGSDDIFGDSGEDQAYGDRTIDQWRDDEPSDGVHDDIVGGNEADHLEGDGGGDTILGGSQNDHVEGNDGDDTIYGEGGDDDLIGGSDTAGVDDVGEALVSGGVGQDVIAGDNATIVAVGYVKGRTVTLLDLDDVTIGGGDTIEGDAESDAAFGQQGNDTIWGDHGLTGPFQGAGAPDYAEGNNGNDTIHGEAGGDDIVGGNSAIDGVIDANREGTGLADVGETLLDGGADRDWIAGDNARMDRVLGNGIDYPNVGFTPILLFDLSKAGSVATGTAFGADNVTGGTGSDLIFGQGGNDNALEGNEGTDYIEGNDGDDTIRGGDDDDDLIGGGSAEDGIIDQVRVGETLHDGGETLISGGNGVDFIAGDNAFMNRVLFPADTAPIDLFDINSADTNVSGGDLIHGDPGDDLIFGQGNGSQVPTQADPDDDYDNDLDGRESGASLEYDCADGSDNDADSFADAADPQCAAAIDEDAAWDGDIIHGDDGNDYAEGNHGADWIFGGNDQDDLIGGGSAIDGVIDAVRTGVGLNDWADVIHGDASHDVITGDNAVVKRPGGNIVGANVTFPILQRTVEMATSPEDAGKFGNDHLMGDAGHDQIYGQQGNDLIEGNADDDAVVGDLGTIVSSVETGSREAHIAPKLPFVQDDIFEVGTLTHLTELFSQQAATATDGNDIILGGQGHDDLHGGPGNDVMNGDLYADTTTLPDPDLLLKDMQPGDWVFDDPADPNSVLPYADEDAAFGGYGNDVIWGGRGPDHIYGGHGGDSLDVRPRPATAQFEADPPSWFTWTKVGATQESYQDSDVIYGGWGADVMQANLAANGPQDGDKLFDWVGAYNLYYICASTYGDWVATRAIQPDLLSYFEKLSAGDGLLNPATTNSSGFQELALVYTKDVKSNSNPAHPETPGHFYCGDGFAP